MYMEFDDLAWQSSQPLSTARLTSSTLLFWRLSFFLLNFIGGHPTIPSLSPSLLHNQGKETYQIFNIAPPTQKKEEEEEEEEE